MTEFEPAELERIARELGYADWQDVPAIPRRHILECDELPRTADRVDDWLAAELLE